MVNKDEDTVQVEDISFSYDRETILKHTSFAVAASEFVAIIGPNGGGKTTLLKLLLGFLKPQSGQIKILGLPPEKACLHMAYVPQVHRIDREFPISVREVVLEGLLSKLPWYGFFSKDQIAMANSTLEKVGLAEFIDVPFGTLSGGQAQRVLIARALISEPKILLLDEPTASVDARAEGEIYKLLATLKGNHTILMVTHDLTAAVKQVDRVLCVQGNVTSLQPEEVCQHFAYGLYHSPLVMPGGSKD